MLASEEQVAAFETGAQPVFEQIEQDPRNAEFIAAIRELKAKTEASPLAEACALAPATTFNHGNIPSELIGTWSFNAFAKSWTAELTADGAFSLYGQMVNSMSAVRMGSLETRPSSVMKNAAPGRSVFLLRALSLGVAGDRLMFTVIEDKCVVGKIEQWTAGWQKLEKNGQQVCRRTVSGKSN